MNFRLLMMSLTLVLCNSTAALAQENRIYTIRNCQRELRTVTFQGQTNIFWKMVAKWTTIKDQKLLRFADEYNLDTTLLQSNIQQVRSSLPAGFWEPTKFAAIWLNNEPDEKAIWFIEVFAQEDKKGNVKVFAAYKITFEGVDATSDLVRRNPKIRHVEFIFDKAELEKLKRKISILPEA